MTAAPLERTARTAVRRKKERGSYERALVDRVLDEGYVCHVGFSDGDATYVVPMTYVRVEDALYLHGAAANRTLRALAGGTAACVTVTLLDGFVLARSAFHSSMNYRSVMLLGELVRVADVDEQRMVSAALADRIAPGRGREIRAASDVELRATLILRLTIAEGSAKVRTGPPIEEPEDLGLPVWAGELPLALVAGDPVPDPLLPAGAAVPDYVTGHRLRAPGGAA